MTMIIFHKKKVIQYKKPNKIIRLVSKLFNVIYKCGSIVICYLTLADAITTL